MLNEIEYKGQWFLPSSPEKRVNGILTYNYYEGAELELFGSLNTGINIPLIHGITSNSLAITLFTCYVKRFGGQTLVSNNEIGIPTHCYAANYILEGHHFKIEQDLIFNEIKAEIFNLDEWIGVSGFNNPEKNFENYRYIIDYSLPEQIHFNITSKLSGTFNFQTNLPSERLLLKEISIKQKAQLILFSESALPFKVCLDNLFTFVKFLTLSFCTATYPTSIELTRRTLPNSTGERSVIVKLYFSIKSVKKVSETKDSPEMLFNYQMIQDKFDLIISRWYELRDSLLPVHNLLFEQYYNDSAFNENWFLNLAQAAETLHSRLNKEKTKIPEEEYDKMKKEVRSFLPEKYVQWLNNEFFPFGNSLNLDQRLNDLIDKYSNPTIDKIINDRADFVSKVKQSRNYYTHYNYTKDKKALKVLDLFHLAQQLKPLIISAYLEETGFTHDEVAQMMKSHIIYFRPFRTSV